jgi:hypothetical protein
VLPGGRCPRLVLHSGLLGRLSLQDLLDAIGRHPAEALRVGGLLTRDRLGDAIGGERGVDALGDDCGGPGRGTVRGPTLGGSAGLAGGEADQQSDCGGESSDAGGDATTRGAGLGASVHDVLLDGCRSRVVRR